VIFDADKFYAHAVDVDINGDISVEDSASPEEAFQVELSLTKNVWRAVVVRRCALHIHSVTSYIDRKVITYRIHRHMASDTDLW
jgi:hypothetical protein